MTREELFKLPVSEIIDRYLILENENNELKDFRYRYISLIKKVYNIFNEPFMQYGIIDKKAVEEGAEAISSLVKKKVGRPKLERTPEELEALIEKRKAYQRQRYHATKVLSIADDLANAPRVSTTKDAVEGEQGEQGEQN